MLQPGLADECCEAIHIQIPMQGGLHAYNISGQLVGSIKSMFIESKYKECYVSQHGKYIMHGNQVKLSISYNIRTIPA